MGFHSIEKQQDLVTAWMWAVQEPSITVRLLLQHLHEWWHHCQKKHGQILANDEANMGWVVKTKINFGFTVGRFFGLKGMSKRTRLQVTVWNTGACSSQLTCHSRTHFILVTVEAVGTWFTQIHRA